MKEARGLRGIWSYVGRMRLMEVRHPDGRPAPDVYKKTPEEICFLQRQDGLSQDVELSLIHISEPTRRTQ